MTPPEANTGSTWRRLASGELSWEILRKRSLLMDRTRNYFNRRGFLEVDPPIAVRGPNIDPNVFPVVLTDHNGSRSDLFLHTSPELSMKKLIAAGSGNLFHLGKVFRDREGSPIHHPEFTMLEWYRVGEPAGAVMADVEGLVRELAVELYGEEKLRCGDATVSLSRKWARVELAEAFLELVGAPMAGDEEGLRSALARKGMRPGEDETWEDLFHRACIDIIEPALEKMGLVFISGFPSPLAAMAGRRKGDAGICERFEGYVFGVELVNGYEELTDPSEQEERLRQLASRHERRSGIKLPVDGDFLEAMRHGLPPCSGAALGFDRLAMLLLEKDTIADVTIR